MKFKNFDAHVKAADGDSGEFEAIVSVFNNVDSVGDVVMPGAFADTLKSWADSGATIPVIWSHQWADPDSHIGEVLEAKELLPGDPLLPAHLSALGGLWVRGALDGDAKAQKVRRLLKGHRVKNFSFAYDVLDGAPAERGGQPVYELRKLGLLEVGPTLIGANRETELIGAKADHVLSATVARLEAAIEQIAVVAASAATDEPKSQEEPLSHPPAEGHPDEPSRTPLFDPLLVLASL